MQRLRERIDKEEDTKSLSTQMVERTNSKIADVLEYEGGDKVTSTGSTLLDLAISGGRFKEGGIPSGILVEIFGPSGCGKTVLLCKIAAEIQKQSGQVMFLDPEARLNKKFAQLFGVEIEKMEYGTPDTVPKVFDPVRKWSPKPEGKVHGIFTDSLAALTTDMELEDKDDYGMRRAKEFSQELRKTCRTLTSRDFLMVCSNQVRQNIGAGPYEQQYTTPGGEGISFYSSLRLRCFTPKKLPMKRMIRGKEHKRIVGVTTQIEVFKSSIWKPFRSAPVSIVFDYGVDDIRQNLQFVKTIRGDSVYVVGDNKLDKSLDDSITMIEEGGLEEELRQETIELWGEVERSFDNVRKSK